MYVFIYIYIIFVDDKNTCESEHTQFCDPHHKHIPGNLIIIDNPELQKLMAKGPKIQGVSNF